MADVLISLDDNTENMLRELAKELHGGKKGSLSNATSDAIAMLYQSIKRAGKKGSLTRLFKTLDMGYHLGYSGKKVYEHRAELYESRT